MLFRIFRESDGSQCERDQAADTDEGGASQHDEVGDSVAAAEDDAHDQKRIKVTFCDPSESACDAITNFSKDISMFIIFIFFIFLFEAPFEVIMASDAHFKKFSIEPEDNDGHEEADEDSEVEVREVEGALSIEEGEISRHGMNLSDGEAQPSEERDICDIIRDGIEPLAFMARAHPHAGEFAIDTIDHGGELPEDDGESHEEGACAGVIGCSMNVTAEGHQTSGEQAKDESEGGDHIRGNG